MAEQTIQTSSSIGIKYSSVLVTSVIPANIATVSEVSTLTARKENYSLAVIANLVTAPVISSGVSEVSTLTARKENYSLAVIANLVTAPVISSGASLSIQIFRSNHSNIDLEKFKDASDTYFSTGGSGSGSNQFWS